MTATGGDPRAAAIALLAGSAAAVLQLAGGLKTALPAAHQPFDLTIAALAVLLPALALLSATRRWQMDPLLALPVAAALLLPLWLLLAGSWSASRGVAGDKLMEVVLAGPAMLAAGMLVGADAAARRALVAVSLLIGLAMAGATAWTASADLGLRIPLDPDRARAQYQLAGLAMAIAAGLAAVRAAEARGPLGLLPWVAVVLALNAAALLPGGRTALVALGLGVTLAPALRFWLDGRRGAAAAWLAGGAALALVFAFELLLHPEHAEGLRTLERLVFDAAGLEARLELWSAALRWAGEAAPFGLGTGGFGIAVGHGERRGRHPHNHPLEALAEGGLPAFLLWLLAFGGGLVAAMLLLRRVGDPGRAARIAAMVLPVALTVMVSTDLGNRMAWFALGLALSLGLRAAVPGPGSTGTGEGAARAAPRPRHV